MRLARWCLYLMCFSLWVSLSCDHCRANGSVTFGEIVKAASIRGRHPVHSHPAENIFVHLFTLYIFLSSSRFLFFSLFSQRGQQVTELIRPCCFTGGVSHVTREYDINRKQREALQPSTNNTHTHTHCKARQHRSIFTFFNFYFSMKKKRLIIFYFFYLKI